MNRNLLCKPSRPLAPLLIAALLSILVSMIAPAGARAQDGSAAQEILASINAQRGQAGLAPLAENALLNQAAQTQANDILWNSNYSHWGSDGTVVAQRVARTGYAANPAVSENWVSSSSPAGAMQWWMGDYIHRVNILTGRWVEIGVGVADSGAGEMIFVTVFSAGYGEGTVAAAAMAAPQEAPAYVPPPAPLAVPAGGLDYEVQAGDTLLAIALHYGMDWPEVAAVNGLDEHTLLQIGQIVRIPGSGEESSSANTPLGGPVGGVGVPYTVQAGETLFSIASLKGLTWQELAAFNGMGERDTLQIGQIVQVPATEPLVEPDGEAVAEPVAESAGADASEPPNSPLDETRASADEFFGATASSLRATESQGSPDGDTLSYTLQDGDTIFGVALAHGVDWLEVLRLNGLTEDSLLQPGMQIRLR